jgi:hypothetical protein
MLVTLGLIPVLILIHTLKPKPRQIDITNLFLWREVLKERSSQITFDRLKRNLPLYLQILLVILAALALAKPAWLYFASKQGNMILVIDTSASMKTQIESFTRFDMAREKAIELIAQRHRDQKILIIAAGNKPAVKGGFLNSSMQAKQIVANLSPTDAAAELAKAIYLALSFMDPLKKDRLYLITDGGSKDIAALVQHHPRIQPVIISGGARNIGITKFEFRRAIEGIDTYEIMLEVKNFNSTPLGCFLRLSVDHAIVFDRPLEFDAREKKLLILPYAGLLTGIAKAVLEVDDDFATDNRAYLSLNASKDIWVLLVSKGNHFLEKLLEAYPNFKVNSVKEIIPSSWQEQTARHDIVIVDRIDFPTTTKGNFLLIDAYSSSLPVEKSGQVPFPKIVDWDKKDPLMANVDLGGLMVEQAARLHVKPRMRPIIESNQTGLMYVFEDGGFRAVLLGFDITRSDLPLKVAFPVMMSNIVNWLNPHKLDFSVLHTRAGEPFDIYLDPQTEDFYTRAPQEKWQKQRAAGNPFRYTRTHNVGVYTISENDKQRYFTANLTDESESDIGASFLQGMPNKSVEAAETVNVSVRHPLWAAFVLLALFVLLVEWYLWLKVS